MRVIPIFLSDISFSSAWESLLSKGIGTNNFLFLFLIGPIPGHGGEGLDFAIPDEGLPS